MKQAMKQTYNNQEGFALVVSLLILTAIALLAICLYQVTRTEIHISSNYRDIVRNFYISESSNQFERVRVADDQSINVIDITKRNTLYQGNATKQSSSDPTCESIIIYHNYEASNNIPGYSAESFNKYYFTVETRYPLPSLNKGTTAINTFVYKIGPQLER